jgi:hypothetical protein
VKCSRQTVRYDETEELILANLPGLRPEQVLPNPDEQAAACLSLRQRIEGKAAELSSLEAQVENLIDQVAATADRDIRGRYEARIKALMERKAAVEAERTADESELARAESGLRSLASWKRELATLQRALKTGDVETRVKLRTHLRELLDKVEVFASGHRKGEDPLAEGLWSIADDYFGVRLRSKSQRKLFGDFVDLLTGRRATREGRFLRLYFKGGGQVDLAPPGSLAIGSAMGDKGELSRTVRPDFAAMWEEFEAKKGASGGERVMG